MTENIPGIEKNSTQSETERRKTTLNCIVENYPSSIWIHDNTDRSIKKKVYKNGGGAIILNIKKIGAQTKQRVTTRKCSSKFRAKVGTLKTAAEMLLAEENRNA